METEEASYMSYTNLIPSSSLCLMAREDSKERYILRDQRFSERDIARESFLQGINIQEHLRWLLINRVLEIFD